MANIRIKDLSTTASSTASDDFFGVDGATNGTRKLDAYSPTFGGNLTVSGGTIGTAASTNLTLSGGSSGASLVLGQGASAAVTITPTGGVPTTTLVGYVAAGTLNSGNVNSADATATLRTRGNLAIDGTGRNANGADSYLIAFHADAGSVNGFVGSLITSYINGANFSSATYFKTRNGATAAAEVGRFTSSGNLLVGTTTDSANGKLQLATHTTSAGGIGFGTDVSLYRGSAGYAVLSVSTAGGGFTVANSTNGGQIVAQSAGTPMFLLSDTTQALNEKLWGVRSSSASFIIGAWTDSFSGLNNAIKIDRSGATPSLVTVTPNLTVTGAIAIGNTVNTVSPTSPNRTITMVIGGTTYYLHAKTTND